MKEIGWYGRGEIDSEKYGERNYECWNKEVVEDWRRCVRIENISGGKLGERRIVQF